MIETNKVYKMEIQKIEGKIILSAKNVNRFLERNVIKNNKTSGKITLPPKLINKKVYVVWFEEGKE
jgi:putative transposon-encoded protein